MVSRASCQCKAIAKNNNWLFIILLFIFMIFTTLVVAVLLFDRAPEAIIGEDTSEESSEEIDYEPITEELELPELISFQNLVDDWANSLNGNRSVLIYDLERDEEVGAYNPDESYNTASLYKLFVVYEGYRRLQSGAWSASDAAGGTGQTIIECLDLAIRESNSPCAETLWSMIGRENLNGIIINEFGITNSNIASLISNPRDIMRMMKIFYQHEEIIDENLLAVMQDSFLNQAITDYDWRQGLPSGFSRANVYNKVGWDYNPDGKFWNIYHDAAIIEFPEDGRHFIVVVMTNRVPYQKITELGQLIENYYYNQ